jgi:ABC-type multidrug transport system fused ATPase/permease subunit
MSRRDRHDVPAVRAVSDIRLALVSGARVLAAHPASAALLIAATLSQGALQAAVIWSVKGVLGSFTRIGAQVSWGALLLGAGAVYALWIARAATGAMGELLSSRLARRAELDMMHRVLEKLLTLGLRHFDKRSPGDIVMAAYHDLKSVRTVAVDLCSIMLHGSRLLGLVVVAWAMSPTLALLGFLLVPLALLPAQGVGQRLTEAALRERESLTGILDRFLEIGAGFRMIAVNRAEPRVLENARAASARLLKAIVRQERSKAQARVLFESVSGLGLALVLAVGGREVALGKLSWQALLSLLVAMIAIYAPLLGLLQVYSGMRLALPGLERLNSLMAQAPDVHEHPHARPLHTPPRTIALEHVSFAYNDGQPVVHDVSVTFHAGETIGIVGPSGAGKSTLLSLLLRLYDPTSGRILLDGVDLREVRRDDYLALCALVPQEPYLLLETVSDNIRAARPDATMDEVIAAATAANLHQEILRMPGGYDGVLGRREDAHGVSTGQKQRIAIAGALLKNAPFLFLDEATSNLDSVSERLVQSALVRLMAGRTTFVVAHRLSTLRAADRILVMDRGQLTAVGTHDHLMDHCDVYRRLWNSQQFGESGARLRTSSRGVAHAGPA